MKSNKVEARDMHIMDFQWFVHLNKFTALLSTIYGIGAQYEQSHDPVCPSEGESGNPGDSESDTFMASDVLRLAW